MPTKNSEKTIIKKIFTGFPTSRLSLVGHKEKRTKKQKLNTRANFISLSTLIIILLGCPTNAFGQEVNTKNYTLVIPSTDIDLALFTLARKSGKSLIIPSKGLVQQKTIALNGVYSVSKALELMLQGTSFSGDLTESGMIVITHREGAKPPNREKTEVTSNQLKKSLLATVSAIVFGVGGGTAFAQEAETTTDRDGIQVTPTQGEQDNKFDNIVVTGSRITRSGFSSQSPLTFVDAEDVQTSGSIVLGDILQKIPSVGVGLGSSNSNLNIDAGASFINLRGLGTDRTLVLVNGRRRVSGSRTSSAVDLNTIPAASIDRMEIITGGASAVYGADAVTGVVNVMTRDDFEGVELSVQSGMSTQGDGGETYSANLFAGTGFDDDRGSLTFGVSYSKENTLMANDREFSREGLFLFSNPDNTGPADGIPDSRHYENFRFPNTHPAGVFFAGGTGYTVDPGLRLLDNDPLFFGFIGIGGDGFNISDFNQLRVGFEAFSAMTNVKYDISTSLRFFAESDFSHTEAQDNQQPQFDFGLRVGRDNPFLSAEVGTLMDANSLSDIFVSRTHYDHGREVENIDRDVFNITTGFEGTFADVFEWEAFYQFGHYSAVNKKDRTRINSRFQQAIDIIADPVTGNAICADAAARANGCIALNILGRDVASQDALDYFQHTRLQSATNTQQVFGANLTGELWELPAGPLKFSLGAEHRKEETTLRDDGLATTGQLFLTTPGTQPLDAEFSVSEAYIETLLPLTSRDSKVGSLNVEGALRYSDYETIGDTIAWKIGGDWSPVDDIRFRATLSRSVRAPNLNELFSAGTSVIIFPIDPCDEARVGLAANREANCRALGVNVGYSQPGNGILSNSGGNSNLTEEKSDSITFGAVMNPSMLPGLALSVDYWDIEIEDAINTTNAQTILDRCVDSSSVNNPFCSLVTRQAGGSLTAIDVREINIGQLMAKGIDFHAQYDFELSSGDVSLGLTGTHLLKHEELVDAADLGSLILSDGELENPHWRANLVATYTTGPWLTKLNTRYVSSSEFDVQASEEAFDRSQSDSKIYNDVLIKYSFSDERNIFVGVNNVFNVTPPNLDGVRANGAASGRGVLFDNIGRFAFVGAKIGF